MSYRYSNSVEFDRDPVGFAVSHGYVLPKTIATKELLTRRAMAARYLEDHGVDVHCTLTPDQGTTMTLNDVTSAEVREDLYSGGPTESFGVYAEGSAYYVVAEAPDGSLFQHEHVFSTTFETSEDGFAYATGREEAKAAAEALCARVNARLANGGKLSPAAWTESRPGYGSEAYVRDNWSLQDAHDERVRDREQESFR